MRYSSKAHLVVWLRTDCGIPSIIDCKIHSAGPSGLTGTPGVIYAEIAQISAESYHEAHKQMMEICKSTPGLEWTRAFLEEGATPFMERTALLSFLRRGMPGILPGTSEWSREIGDPSERELILFRHDFRDEAYTSFMKRYRCGREEAKAVFARYTGA